MPEASEQNVPPPKVTDSLGEPGGGDARLRALWRAKYVIVAVTLLAGALTYLISGRVPGVYRSSAEVLVTTLSPAGATQTSVQAANDLATQYAQQVVSDDVVGPAARSLKISSSTLQDAVSAGTVSAQNLISIAADGPSPAVAQSRANAVAASFVAVQRARSHALIKAFERTANHSSAGLEAAISSLDAQLRNSSLAVRKAAAGELPLLLAQQAKNSAQITISGAESLPAVSMFASAGPGTEILPRTKLYVLLALVLAFLVSCQASVLVLAGGQVKSDRSG